MHESPTPLASPAFDLDAMARHAGEAAQLLKALSNTRRLMVMCILSKDGELPFGNLHERVPLSQSALSQHLAVLRREGLVATRREAQTIYYRLADPKAVRIIALLHELFCSKNQP